MTAIAPAAWTIVSAPSCRPPRGVNLSELVVGGPTAIREFLSPTVGYTVSFGSVHGYVEAYGDQAEAVTVKYEIALGPSTPALIAADVPGRLFGDDRMIFTHVMPVRELPPGPYVMRALVSVAGRPLKTLLRSFEVAKPAAGAVADRLPDDSATAPEADAEIFLPVDDQVFVHPFKRDEALTPAILEPFRTRRGRQCQAGIRRCHHHLDRRRIPKGRSESQERHRT